MIKTLKVYLYAATLVMSANSIATNTESTHISAQHLKNDAPLVQELMNAHPDIIAQRASALIPHLRFLREFEGKYSSWNTKFSQWAWYEQLILDKKDVFAFSIGNVKGPGEVYATILNALLPSQGWEQYDWNYTWGYETTDIDHLTSLTIKSDRPRHLKSLNDYLYLKKNPSRYTLLDFLCKKSSDKVSFAMELHNSFQKKIYNTPHQYKSIVQAYRGAVSSAYPDSPKVGMDFYNAPLSTLLYLSNDMKGGPFYAVKLKKVTKNKPKFSLYSSDLEVDFIIDFTLAKLGLHFKCSASNISLRQSKDIIPPAFITPHLATKWSGVHLNGRSFDGKGEIQFEDHFKILGEIKQSVLDGGEGKLLLFSPEPDTSIEIASSRWSRGQASAYGHTIAYGALIYEGMFRNGEPHGIGHKRKPFEQYKGEFVDGRYHGKGHLIEYKKTLAQHGKNFVFDDHRKYETKINEYTGKFYKGKKHGEGVCVLYRPIHQRFICRFYMNSLIEIGRLPLGPKNANYETYKHAVKK